MNPGGRLSGEKNTGCRIPNWNGTGSGGGIYPLIPARPATGRAVRPATASARRL
ncbi:hypothetical protein LJK87_25300 [Paenibacillus sp. P25]|nr:hypothetical protein LJK87_25300 [Paenibacillus sp. P25]